MINPQTISEQLIFSTVRFESLSRDGSISTGTAFFFEIEIGQGRSIPLLITNKYVVANTHIGSFRLHEGKQSGDQLIPSGGSVNVRIENLEQLWIPHPSKDVDLGAMLLGPLFGTAAAQGKAIYYKCANASFLPTNQDLENLRAVESILMVGYPNGLWDTINNLPLVRRGITATHPAIDFMGKPVSVIDMACFPGSSGSPVLIVDEGSYVNKAGTLVAGANRLFLLGVLYGGPTITATGDIVITEIPTDKTAISQTAMMMHLGYIVKARELVVLGDAVKQHARKLGEDID